MASRLLSAVTEKDFQHSVEQLCDTHGLLHYHVVRSDKGLVTHKGFPDLVITGNRTIFAELKTETGRLSLDQQMWLGGLRHSGMEVYIWRPSDMPLIISTLHGLKLGR